LNKILYISTERENKTQENKDYERKNTTLNERKREKKHHKNHPITPNYHLLFTTTRGYLQNLKTEPDFKALFICQFFVSI